MGDEARGANSTRAAAERNDDGGDWRDEQITVVEKRVEKPTIQGMPPLERPPAKQS